MFWSLFPTRLTKVGDAEGGDSDTLAKGNERIAVGEEKTFCSRWGWLTFVAIDHGESRSFELISKLFIPLECSWPA